jgi:hypothetical protein
MICTLCLSTKHVAASCPYRPRWRDRAIAVVFCAVVTCGRIAQFLQARSLI